ncbi:hypothetical protein ACWGKX_25995, partial [Streptomyces tricolor]
MAVRTKWTVEHTCGHEVVHDLSDRAADRRAGGGRGGGGRGGTPSWEAAPPPHTPPPEGSLATNPAAGH